MIYVTFLLKFVFQKSDRGKRFEYLLKQTEIFSHFMTNQSKTSSSGSPPKQKGRPRKEPLPGSTGDPGEYVIFLYMALYKIFKNKNKS